MTTGQHFARQCRNGKGRNCTEAHRQLEAVCIPPNDAAAQLAAQSSSVEIVIIAMNQPRLRLAAVRLIEAKEYPRYPGGRHPEHRALIECSARRRCAIEVSICSLDNRVWSRVAWYGIIG